MLVDCGVGQFRSKATLCSDDFIRILEGNSVVYRALDFVGAVN